ncbi:SAM-dependent methyltransferase [Mycobacterium talmoniae]|uniref:S-adenosyl-L-methionine-dependent methyltransferase n=1 Tax=Mycobacterium talmoniae TaxID=1858794 RepID=A0A1S1NQ16_9MYCO|nr:MULTISPECIES: SAM-dependent methyltransferase [Mycobacterium]OHV06607.1 SAM-dependent methyltransferase [Mycobacterium talmoniae]PQM49523.1 Putative S-adenosyl-L-methionine-dependent methyltransferase [Mycobacterium talmoniae]TDH55509.1 SAM-dependent methyltransferase [Mycobacterium eburneum]
MDAQHRKDNDTWDLATSVGATATMVAAARAAACNTADPLIDDAFAEPLVRAVGIDFLTRWASGGLGVVDDGVRRVLDWFVDLMAVRTRYFDAFFMDATTAGIRQAVNLASGLDTRSYRLAWPPGCTVFEIDQPQVIEFKVATLARLHAEPTADLRMVPIDLRHDWPTALRRAGFDPSLPTAWIAEGLLPFLPPEAQDRLLDTVTAHSAVGSRLATEIFVPPTHEMMQPITYQWREHGFGIQPSDLVYDGVRNDVAAYLDHRGWQSVTTPMSQLLAENQLPPRDHPSPFVDNAYYTAIRLGESK